MTARNVYILMIDDQPVAAFAKHADARAARYDEEVRQDDLDWYEAVWVAAVPLNEED